jgi:hypothetical protein
MRIPISRANGRNRAREAKAESAGGAQTRETSDVRPGTPSKRRMGGVRELRPRHRLSSKRARTFHHNGAAYGRGSNARGRWCGTAASGAFLPYRVQTGRAATGPILLKKSEIEPPRKSRFRARRLISGDSPHGRACRSRVRGKTGRSAEPPSNSPSRLPAVV